MKTNSKCQWVNNNNTDNATQLDNNEEKAKVTSKGIIILLNKLTGNEAHHLADE